MRDRRGWKRPVASLCGLGSNSDGLDRSRKNSNQLNLCGIVYLDRPTLK